MSPSIFWIDTAYSARMERFNADRRDWVSLGSTLKYAAEGIVTGRIVLKFLRGSAIQHSALSSAIDPLLVHMRAMNAIE